jgi:hypothetical protein
MNCRPSAPKWASELTMSPAIAARVNGVSGSPSINGRVAHPDVLRAGVLPYLEPEPEPEAGAGDVFVPP